MNAVAAESPGWSRRQMGLIIAGLMLAQTGIIFWLDRGAIPARGVTAAGLTESLPLGPEGVWAEDPALLALAHPEGFSGRVWAHLPPPEYPVTEWNERARWLDPSVDRLGEALRGYVQTNGLRSLEVARRPDPQLEHPEIYPMLELTPTQSTLRIEGSLANRPLLAAPLLTAWPATNTVLAATEVQIVVDPGGRVLTVTPLTPSGSKDADNAALSLARELRFTAAPGATGGGEPAPVGRLDWGRLIFQWQTIAPPPATNASPGTP